MLIVAHRLPTIIDSDRILVMETGGTLSQYDHPYSLLVEKIGDRTITKRDGRFAEMVLATGDSTSQSLLDIARSKYFEKNND